MPVTETNASFDAVRRRHPRTLRGISWLRSHPVLCGTAGAMGIAAVFFLDLSAPGYLMTGLYVVPVFFLAIAVDWRAVAFAVAVCIALSAFVFLWEDSLDVDRGLVLLYAAMIGGALVILSYLIRRLSTATEYAVLRAQLSEAGADILSSGRSGDDLDELLEYALERLGEQLDATSGVLLLLENGAWEGRAGFGLGVDARQVVAQYAELPLAAQALRSDAAASRDFTGGDPSPLAPLAVRMSLERALVIPVRSLEREIGVLFYNRPQDLGEYSGEQVALAEGLARYIGVTVDNVRLMVELDTRRRDLELVRDSSLDFAQSIDMGEVLEAVVTRLVGVLDMHACDIYEVDVDAGVMRNLVSYDDGEFDTGEWMGRVYPIEYFATSAMAIRSRRPIMVTSPEDPRLNYAERDLMNRWGHKTQLTIPLRIGEQVSALVELLDDREGRDFSDEEVELARSICRFAALAIDKARLFDQQRATAERRDRLARRLQRLQSFAVDLNQRLDRADLQEVLDEVTRAAVDLLHTRSAAVVVGSGGFIAVRSLALDGAASPSVLAAAEAELLERCTPGMTPAGEDFAGADSLTVSPGADTSLLFAPLEGEATAQPSVLVVADKQEGEFDDEDRMLLATLAAQLNASMHNAIAYQREHVIAETFQQALLMEPPAIPGIEVGVHLPRRHRLGARGRRLLRPGLAGAGQADGHRGRRVRQEPVGGRRVRRGALHAPRLRRREFAGGGALPAQLGGDHADAQPAVRDARGGLRGRRPAHVRVRRRGPPAADRARRHHRVPHARRGQRAGGHLPRRHVPDQPRRATGRLLHRPLHGRHHRRAPGGRPLRGGAAERGRARQPAARRSGAGRHSAGDGQGVCRRRARRRLRRRGRQTAVGGVRPPWADGVTPRRPRATLKKRTKASASMKPSRRPPASTTTARSVSRSRSSRRTSAASVSGVTDGSLSAGVITSRTRSRSYRSRAARWRSRAHMRPPYSAPGSSDATGRQRDSQSRSRSLAAQSRVMYGESQLSGLCHEARGRDAGQQVVHLGLARRRARRLDQQPPDEHEPDAAQAAGQHQLGGSQGDESPSEHLADHGGLPRGTDHVVREPPQEGAQDPPAVERESRQEVEDHQGEVGDAQVGEHGDHLLRSVQRGGGCERGAADHDAHQRSGDRHPRFAARRVGLTFQLRHSTQGEQA